MFLLGWLGTLICLCWKVTTLSSYFHPMNESTTSSVIFFSWFDRKCFGRPQQAISLAERRKLTILLSLSYHVLHVASQLLLCIMIWSSFFIVWQVVKASLSIMQVWSTIMCIIICDNMLVRCLCSPMNIVQSSLQCCILNLP